MVLIDTYTYYNKYINRKAELNHPFFMLFKENPDIRPCIFTANQDVNLLSKLALFTFYVLL